MSSASRKPLRLLLSYHYYKDKDLTELLSLYFQDIPVDIFVDSGAYSAFSVGASVDPDEYATWVARWEKHITAAAGPDVIGDSKATDRETDRMLNAKKWSIPILPTFHVGSDWKGLESWAERVDYLALGGMVPHATKHKFLQAWLHKAFRIIDARARVHLFGMTNFRLMQMFPFYSADSSSWTSGVRFAQLLLFDSNAGAIRSLDMRDRKSLLKNSELLGRYDIRPHEANIKTHDRRQILGVAAETWRRAEDWLNGGRVSSSKPGANTPTTSRHYRKIYLAHSRAADSPAFGQYLRSSGRIPK